MAILVIIHWNNPVDNPMPRQGLSATERLTAGRVVAPNARSAMASAVAPSTYLRDHARLLLTRR